MEQAEIPKIVPGRVFGYYLETDDYTPYGATGEQAFDLLLGTSGIDSRIVRYTPNTRKYRDAIYKAVQKVALMNLKVERITILKGVVQAHPELENHWRCPFCYPEEPTAEYKFSEPVFMGKMPLETVKELIKEKFCSCKTPLPPMEWYKPFGGQGQRVCSSCGFRRETKG